MVHEAVLRIMGEGLTGWAQFVGKGSTKFIFKLVDPLNLILIVLHEKHMNMVRLNWSRFRFVANFVYIYFWVVCRM